MLRNFRRSEKKGGRVGERKNTAFKLKYFCFKRIDHHICFFLLMFKYFSAFMLDCSRLDKYVALQFMLKTFSASEKNRPMSICAHLQ